MLTWNTQGEEGNNVEAQNRVAVIKQKDLESKSLFTACESKGRMREDFTI